MSKNTENIVLAVVILFLWYGIPFWAKWRVMDRDMPKASEWITWLTIFFLGPLTFFILLKTFFVPVSPKRR